MVTSCVMLTSIAVWTVLAAARRVDRCNCSMVTLWVCVSATEPSLAPCAAA
jgi:hypothetical protein